MRSRYGRRAFRAYPIRCVGERIKVTGVPEFREVAWRACGRNMAGVHFFSDYYDSLRMGEKIALGILEEQAICYPTDPFVLSAPTFDGDVYRNGNR